MNRSSKTTTDGVLQQRGDDARSPDGRAELPAPSVAVRNIRVRYRNGALGISNVSLEIQAGQIASLLGPNGAGKTTTVRAISGFLKGEGARIEGGAIEVFGTNVTGLEPHRIAKLGVSVVPERTKIFPRMTVNENLRAIGRLPKRDKRKSAYDHVYSLFPILSERRHQLAGSLSGGQQQMLAIGRCLLSAPRVLLVDELTLGLHESFQEPLFDAIKAIAGAGTAVLLVDERTEFALSVADYFYLLRAGESMLEGPAKEMRGRELLAAGYVEMD